MDNKLLACPFCGGPAELRLEFYTDMDGKDFIYNTVRCADCGARTPRCSNDIEAMEEWNNRV